MDRRTFIMGALSTLGLLAGGFYFAKGSLYRQAVNGVRSLSGEVEARFFINMGDIVDNGEDHTQWQAWFNGVEGIMDRLPFVPLMGNHET